MIEVQNIISAAEAALTQLAAGADEGAEGASATENGDTAAKGSVIAESFGGLFLVDVKVLPGDEVEVYVDCDGLTADGKPRRVTVEDCISLTKAIEARFDRDEEDFSLTVSSAGIGQPLRVARQYRKLVGEEVEVVLAGGAKMVATLEGVTMDASGSGAESITLSYPEKRKAEGKKRPEIVTVTKTFPLADVKTTKEYIDFK